MGQWSQNAGICLNLRNRSRWCCMTTMTCLFQTGSKATLTGRNRWIWCRESSVSRCWSSSSLPWASKRTTKHATSSWTGSRSGSHVWWSVWGGRTCRRCWDGRLTLCLSRRRSCMRCSVSVFRLRKLKSGILLRKISIIDQLKNN